MARIARPPGPVKAVPLNTVHTYPTKNGNAFLNIYSYPQRVPTFMGGSYERGWGALAGHVEIHITEPSGDRISAIKLTLTATQITTIPKTASADVPSALDRMPIDSEETKTKQVTLLHLEQILFEPLKTDSDRDANLLSCGKHVYPFTIELPLVGNKDKKNPPLLPPSCVIEPFLVGPSDAKARQNSSGLFGRSKATGKDQARPAWATVKYQLKLTVQRPGLLKRNLRSYAPFVYLPSPPASATALLLQRRALGAQMAAIVLQRQGDGCQPIETPDEWRRRPLSFLMSPNGPQKLEPEKKSGFLSSLFSGPKKQQTIHWHEAWTFSMPMSGRSSFPLRSGIPFVVRCNTNKPVDLSMGSPLAFRLYRRVRLLSGKKQKAIAMQQEPVAEAALRFALESRGVFRLNGLISLPPNCVPNFEVSNLSLDYYVAVVRVLDGVVLHKEAVNLACPPPVEPKTPYGPFPSGLAWRSAREAALQLPESPSAFDESPPFAPRATSSVSALSTAASTRQRPSFSSIASSSSSSYQATSRRPSMAPSTTSYRSGSTDSAHYASAASSLSHANAASSASAIPMGLAGMANPPPASSAGYAQSFGNLNPVREQGRASSAARAKPSMSPREPSARRTSQADSVVAARDTSDTASIASSRRRLKYSSKGAAPISEANSAGSSVEQDPRQEASRYVHSHEKAPLATMARQDSQSISRAASTEIGSSRRGLFVANADDLPSIPVKTTASTREQANALVGASSVPSRPREKRSESSRRGSAALHSQLDAPSASAATSSRDHRSRRAERQLPVAPALAAVPAAPTSAREHVHVPAPSPAPISQQPTLVDPSALLTNEDLMYGEDMELDLPPSYFEAVYGAEEEDDDA
ncbi:uncharacterized protein UTRI_06299 [Ustilago trichophora]|uniref:Arrestin-like N-terminal domain-containing protein n=1 Tax=Ustilago trichophora TaxID=86804 RepID=A0A5C3EMA5_9BASI|nr:uncharacterized protein UTRI_06299 [Ustilago trichophora]